MVSALSSLRAMDLQEAFGHAIYTRTNLGTSGGSAFTALCVCHFVRP